MAAKTTPDFDTNAAPDDIPDDWEFETVAESAATKAVFEHIGDQFTGLYKGKEYIEREPGADGSDQSFWRHLFTGRDKDTYAVNDSYDLNEKLTNDFVGKWVRLTWEKSIKTGRGMSDLKSFRIDVRK